MLKRHEKFAVDSPQEAVDAMLARACTLAAERVSIRHAVGRVLAQSIATDRDYPPWNTSALDGYAIDTRRIKPGLLRVRGKIVPGESPCMLRDADAVQIFTGGAVPADADAVIAREQVTELTGFIEIGDLVVCPGQGIRSLGESATANEVVLVPGQKITAPQVAALATYGVTELDVFQKVRVAAIVTGTELANSSMPLKPWQIRDANGPALEALFSQVAWIDWRGARHVMDDQALIYAAITEALRDCDVLLLSGGVSVGDYDYVRDAIVKAGGQIVFHRLPIRPGKPLLGATGACGQTIFGLPGNPLSVMVTARRFVVPVLRQRAGLANANEFERLMYVTNGDDQSLNLHWFRLARQVSNQEIQLVFERNSGDLAAAARSDGFVEVSAEASGAGPRPFYSWEI